MCFLVLLFIRCTSPYNFPPTKQYARSYVTITFQIITTYVNPTETWGSDNSSKRNALRGAATARNVVGNKAGKDESNGKSSNGVSLDGSSQGSREENGNCKAQIVTREVSSDERSGSISNSTSTSTPSSNPNGVPNVKLFTLAELKKATRDFRPDTVLGEGGFGRVFKGWVDEKTYLPSRVGHGMAVAVKKSNPDSSQGLEEWQVRV